MTYVSSILIGNESLLVGCGDHLLQEGHGIAAVVTDNPEIRAWADGKAVDVYADASQLLSAFEPGAVDWLLSIANLKLIPAEVLVLAGKGAVNFHDGPLPRYAGLNTPAWAILNGETQHGITWHLIEGGVDEGDILEQRLIDIAPDETAFSLNSKCYAAAMESFPALLSQLSSESLNRQPQDLTQRSYFAADKRPDGGGVLNFFKPAEELARVVRALDFGAYRNPMASPKIKVGDTYLVVRGAESENAVSTAAPGTVLDISGQLVRVATAAGILTISDAVDLTGERVDLAGRVDPGEQLYVPSEADLDVAAAGLSKACKSEAHWINALTSSSNPELALASAARGKPDWQRTEIAGPVSISEVELTAAVLAWAQQSAGNKSARIGLTMQGIATACSKVPGLSVPWVPVFQDADLPVGKALQKLGDQIAKAQELGPFPAELALRAPDIGALQVPDLVLSLNADEPLPGSVATVTRCDAGICLHHDASRLSPAAVTLLTDRLSRILSAIVAPDAGDMLLSDLRALPGTEIRLMTKDWNATDKAFEAGLTIHRAFEEQVARAPDATALVFENKVFSYAELNARANGMAAVLAGEGVAPGSLVGLCVARGPELLIGALAILKAGGAYVPLDPNYPADRLAHYMADSESSVILAGHAQIPTLPQTSAKVINFADHADITTTENVDGGATGDDLAYVIYTSGSTGTPKGVMVEHRNVANFFTGMDDVVERRDDSAWLAVTSLAFDISVLELFYTLARGFKLVLCSDDGRAALSGRPISHSGRPVDFSLYYWSNDCEAGPNKYELLLEGAKFADANGFDALWTPERHFHAFGGPYPNPAVTGAAVAAVTKNLSVRAGSCVGPLHHPARIAEEWAVIDNLTDGKTGLAIACGWQPEDFVLRPENTPPDNKKAMSETIEQLRHLWRGEPVEFPMKSGEMVPVVTQPRPVSDELALWVTTAGNPATWREAGLIGANVLTHLLGQSIEEVGEKITIYHDALREAGHDPGDFTVTVMLHTLIGESRDAVEKIVRGPLKDYLRSAAGLIKQYAWAFPAFKKPKGVTNPFQVDLSTLDNEAMEAILDFAFERYFNDAGLFGTVEDGVARVEELKKIGVGEVACLIDYGVSTVDVMDSLPYLAQVREQSNSPAAVAQGDYSIAAQIIRHGVTHMQCTPSMARMLTMNDEASVAMGRLQHLYLGGEALPGALVEDLRKVTRAQITNMYGPTETTIWSTVQPVAGTAKGLAAMPVGAPIANTAVYVLDHEGAPAPVGVMGELFIGGAGVTRGYWKRDGLTAERFVEDTFARTQKARMYRTGDLACWRADGTLEFLGRVDDQVKIRGQRIELGEIGARLADHEKVHEAHVVARTTPNGSMQLVAYYTARDEVSSAALRGHLERHLPEAMIPTHFVALEDFPLTPNRKVDRKALPDPVAATQRDKLATAPVAEGSAVSCTISAAWARILGVSDIRPSDSFFDLGGHSLLAVQAHRELRTALDLPQLSVTDIFRFPRLSALAAHIEKLSGAAADDAGTANGADSKLVNAETMSKRRAMRAARTRRAM